MDFCLKIHITVNEFEGHDFLLFFKIVDQLV